MVAWGSTAPPLPPGFVDNSDGTVTYTPDSGFSGVDTFDYTVYDPVAGITDTATVTVTVIPNTFDFEPSGATVTEGDTTNTTNVVQLRRSGDLTVPATVDVNLFAGAGDPATPGVDFTAGSDPE